MFWKKTAQPVSEVTYNSIVDKLNEVQANLEDQKKTYDGNIKQLHHDHQLATQKLQANHEIELKEKQFELSHNKDVEIQAAKDQVNDLAQKNAVFENENKMLREITNLNADIIDIKDLVGSLIKKLPEINLTSLTVQNTQK